MMEVILGNLAGALRELSWFW